MCFQKTWKRQQRCWRKGKEMRKKNGRDTKEIWCKDCGQKLSKDDKICSKCGSKKRNISLTFEEKIEIHDQIKGKVKEKDVKKTTQEFKVGDDFHRKSRKWYHREMSIDRKNDSYKEIVKDKTTGKIIHKCEESLSKHIGRGNAKYKKNLKANES